MARGSVVSRGKNTWRIAVELEPDPETGSRRQRWETFHGGKKDAEKRLTELLADVDKGLLGVDPKATLAAYLGTWLQDYASTLAPKTFASYQQYVRLYVVPHLGSVQLGKFTPSHVVRLLSILRDAPRQDGREGKLSASTLSAVYRMLHTALNCAVKWQLISRNPADGADGPRVPRKEMKTFTVEQAQAFLAASEAEGLKWQTFFTLWLHAGSRPGELKALRWTDVDLERGMVSVQQHAQRVRGVGRVVGQPKTAGSRRPVALGPDVVALLRRHRVEQNARRLQMGPLWQDNGLVFPSEIGTILEDKRVHHTFQRVCDRAGVPRIRPYDLRHSSASLLLAAGVHPKIVAERLGHANVNLTLNTYSHVLPTLQQDAANTLEAMLRRAT